MFGSVVQMIRMTGILLVLAMVHTGSAAAADSSSNTRQECEDQLENNSCMEVKDKGDCDSIDPQLCQKTCGLCPVPSSGCPEGFFNTSGPSTQCFKLFGQWPWRNWTEARELCIENGLTLATPNDDVNLGELSKYFYHADISGVTSPWLGGRWSDSTSGFLWDGEQPGSSTGRRALDGHPGWGAGEPGGFVGNNYCLVMWPVWGSTPYGSWRCSLKAATLCQQ